MDKTSKKVTSNKWRIVTNISFGVILLVLFVLTCKMECINQQLKNNNALIQENTSALLQVRNDTIRADCYCELIHYANDEEDEKRGIPKYDYFTTEYGTLNINPSDNVYEAKKRKNLLYTSEEVPSEIKFRFTNELLGFYENYQFVAISPNGEEQIIKPVKLEWDHGPGTGFRIWQFKLCERGTYIIDLRNLDDTTQHQYFSLIW